MGLTREGAFSLLEVPAGSDQESLKRKYKQLALKWHPEKHKNSTEAVKHFIQITQAYRLLAYNNSQEMTVVEARKFFQDVYFSNSCVTNGASDDSTSSDDETDDSDEDVKLEFQFEKLFPGKVKGVPKRRESPDGLSQPQLTPEEINRNAEELITEEERERRKAEKRRAKKKRRKERKKLEKQEQKQEKGKNQKNKGTQEQEKNKKQEKKQASETSSDEQAEFDPTSAFFTKAVSKKKKAASESTQSSRKEKGHERNGAHNGEEEFDVDSTVLRSRQLAIRGNEMAQVEEYNAAIQLFTEAIALDPKDFRFLGNRSYCYDRLQQYEKALKDAEKAIKLSKDWPKGYFRKGRALAGLGKFSEAEESFLQVLKLDKNCEEAVQELQQVRTRQLTDMGFSHGQALAAIKKHATVQAALEALLSGADESLAGEVYVSDEEEFVAPKSIPVSQPVPSQPVDAKMDPKNPEGLTALWVGNVLPQVTERRLTQMFAKYGPVVSVRMLPEKYCAFINFKLKESAGRAMQNLQNQECEGQKLLIRFPDNPINPTGNITLRKNNAAANTSTKPPAASSKGGGGGVRNTPKVTGPVNGDECYFWRTTGCDYGDQCRYKHLPKSKGADKKPWHK
ncbi:uncharacterized protein LOC143302208 isoform X2 [Babylonia areolata]|uniref:uncharacterized protein LOC143302208 isoform X2 n=1 Tax=Babylonia areolata TaxID=304850 RepID=UPI003FD36567